MVRKLQKEYASESVIRNVLNDMDYNEPLYIVSLRRQEDYRGVPTLRYIIIDTHYREPKNWIEALNREFE